MNEEQFIQYLKEQFISPNSIKGIGDDCAVIPRSDGTALLITTDALVEGVHFLKEKISPRDLGYKTVAVNVSDIAAMGGEPVGAFLTIAIPKNTTQKWLKELINGIKEGCKEFNLPLLGGDTVGSKRDLFLNLALIGSAKQDQIKYRDGAKANDLICVTGDLGNSAAGLQVILDNRTEPFFQPFVKAHYRPHIYLKEGQWLASRKEVHSMMDLSDGLDADLKKLLKASICGAVVEISQLPVSETFTEAVIQNKWDPIRLTLSGGEDYALLLTVSKDHFEEMAEAYQNQFSKALYVIGEIIPEKGKLVYNYGGKPYPIKTSSFEHFQIV